MVYYLLSIGHGQTSIYGIFIELYTQDMNNHYDDDELIETPSTLCWLSPPQMIPLKIASLCTVRHVKL